MRRALVPFLVLLATFATATPAQESPGAQDGSNAQEDSEAQGARIQVSIDASDAPSLITGAAFELRIERRWRAPFEPLPLRLGDLAPLEVVERSRRVTTEGPWTVETRLLRAHLFEPGAVAIDGVELVVSDRATGRTQRSLAPALVLDAQNALAPEDDGTVELPLVLLGPSAPVRASWTFALVAVSAIALVLVALRRRARRKRDLDGVDPQELVPAVDADALRGRLDALERTADDLLDPDRDAQWHTELWRVLRGVAGGRLSTSLDASTVTESAARVRDGVDVSTGDGVARVGGDCDRVRFGARSSAGSDRRARVERARDLVRALEREEGRA